MSEILIKVIYFLSIPNGALIYKTKNKISILSLTVYSLIILQCFYFLISYITYVVFGKSIKFPEFNEPGHLKTYSIKITNQWIFHIQTAADALVQFLTIYGSWKYRKSIGYCFEEANDIIKNVYQRYNRRFSYSLSKSTYYIDILSFISKILFNLILIIVSGIFNNTQSVIGILFRTVYLTALFHNNCKQGQFAGLVSVVETALIDINQRIEEFSNTKTFSISTPSFVSILDEDRSNCCNIPMDDYQFHQFFQYQEIIPSIMKINKRNFFTTNSNQSNDQSFNYPNTKEEDKETIESRNLDPFFTYGKISNRYEENLFRLSSKLGKDDQKEEIFGIEDIARLRLRVVHFSEEVMKSYQTYVKANQYLLKLSCPLMLYLMTMSMREGGGPSRVEMSVKHFTAMGFDCLIRVLYLLEICLKTEGIALQNDRTVRNLLAFSKIQDLEPRVAKEVENFLWQIKFHPIEFNAGANTKIRMAYFSSVVTGILRSWIILLQLSGFL